MVEGLIAMSLKRFHHVHVAFGMVPAPWWNDYAAWAWKDFAA